MRGDRPLEEMLCFWGCVFTPHARGSTVPKDEDQAVAAVYPACAGIDLQRVKEKLTKAGLPRMRGDRPCSCGTVKLDPRFTPHARGSTSAPVSGSGIVSVYPACAGIDLSWRRPAVSGYRLPRMRGDRPRKDLLL